MFIKRIPCSVNVHKKEYHVLLTFIKRIPSSVNVDAVVTIDMNVVDVVSSLNTVREMS